ncbi:hypothetical protein ACSLBF_07995 [Pseudoalteromonas sp. T1lg65]|uniref:hypothetical protein n=1 Tax=Pseudoalteromonas sp. T1lg65 TaxID=2077101 RepID=UPI003F7A559C
MKNIFWFFLITIPLFANAENTVSNQELNVQNEAIQSSSTSGKDWFNTPGSCQFLKSLLYGYNGNTDRNPTSVPMVFTNNFCYAYRLTTQNTFPQEMMSDISSEVERHFNVIEHNFKEVSTDPINMVSAQSGAGVRSINSKVKGYLRLRINGRVAANGDIPITINNFDVETVGHLRKYQLGLPINIYAKVAFKNISVQGIYNVYDQRFTGLPNFSQYTPSVTVDVKLPWLFDLLDKLTPGIFDKMYEEFARIVTDVFEFIGVDMGEDIPEVIAHNAQLLPHSLSSITPLNNYRPGDQVYLEMELQRGYAFIKDNNTSYLVITLPLML